MRQLAAALVVVSALSFQISAQGRDRSLERISLALQDPRRGLSAGDPEQPIRVVPIFVPLPGAPKLGPFTLGTAELPGEIIRLSLPIGEFVSRGARGLAVANRQRQEAAARRRVEADLKALAERQSSTRE